MSAMEKFFASLRRLLEPRTEPPAQSPEQPTADRPPPPPEPAPHRQPDPPPYQEVASPDAAPADDLSEVRALLESVAETPVATPEPEAHEDDAQPLLPEPEPTPFLFEEAPTAPSSSNDLPGVEESVAHSDGVGGELVLTLATPPAIFTLARSSATIGRGQENAVRLDDLSVSRRHARIAYRGGGFWLSDLGSMGGTWVDGVKLNAPRRIAAGQVIDIGVCRLTASFAADPAQSVTRKSASKPRSEVAEQPRRRR